MTDETIPAIPTTERRTVRDRLSIIWLVPLLALVVALAVAWQNYNDRGPLIEIRFDNASGIGEEETHLRYRDVDVGVVEDVRFSEDLSVVIVGLRVDKEVAPFIDEQAEFWVVRPEVTTQGISGLDTVLSGVYLEGRWDAVPGTQQFEFEGLDREPLLPSGEQGLEITLRSTDGSLSGNTPIVFKGVEVGRVGPAEVSIDGLAVEARAVVYAPYDNLVTTATRFWDRSGFEVSIGTSGAEVDFDSLASLIAGGITFDTFISGAELAETDEEFTVFSGSDEARASVFNRNDGVTLDLVAIFDGNVAGLETGAAVELNGLRIGEVSGLNGIVEETPSGENRVRLQTILSIQPARLGLEGQGNRQEALEFLTEQVENGLRARLATGSIFTGGLKIQLVATADGASETIDPDGRPFPRIPVTANEITDVATTAQGTLDRIENLPIEELLQSATDFLNASAVLIGSEDTQSVPGEVAALIADVRGVVGSEAVQALPDQVSALMTEFEASVASVQSILAAVDEEATIAEVTRALESITQVTDEVEATLAEMPALVREITALAEQAGALELEALVTEVTALATNAGTLLGSEATQALPDEVTAAVAGLQAVLAEAEGTVAALNDNDGVARILAAADAAGVAAGSLDTALQGVPELVAQIEAVAANAAALPLEDLVAQVSGLAEQAQALIGAEGTQALPAQVGAVATELEATLAEITVLINGLNEAEASARILDAVDATTAAAAIVSDSFTGLPAVIAEIETVAANVAELPLDDFLADISGLAAEAEAILGSEATQALPAQVGAAAEELQLALAEITTLAAELNATGGAERLLAAIDAAATAAGDVSASVEGVPALIDSLNAVASDAEALELDVLIARVTSLVQSADTVLAQDTTRALPGELNAALAEIRLALAAFNEGDAIANTNAALLAARRAADEIAAAAAALPPLMTQTRALLAQADATLAGFEETSPAIRDARETLREITEAAEAVSSLARAIERNPNSLISGR